MRNNGVMVTEFRLDHVMKEPSDVIVVERKTESARDSEILFYICDFLGHRVCVFDENGDFIQSIGDRIPGIIYFPNGIEVSPG